ncbi:outer membrane beta-barrel protein [Prosthecochloris sp. N3]|uniref:Outer membrane beta-barrel protein n=1 Tax=Prosthecochloris ethylica TaxID=2743976 RepID=A0ABR9XPV0_9CHLB|nr:Lpg1974 family pore-forming outer membrane protein [Prosthecochloris ethylica]MBF0586292.1 outer membrane beta-barrel protein [Prosthecochloris ethylica]MBF0635998.1 outer membrane beta-barrel protein [Prosthecochloris ethylica]NUK47327.1 outer membrane beta-barrel protein [Prosthecochloris ethylica]
MLQFLKKTASLDTVAIVSGLKPLALASVIVGAAAVPNHSFAETVPTNEELYQMVLELKAENAQLKKEIENQNEYREGAYTVSESSHETKSDHSGISVGVQVPFISLSANHGAGESEGQAFFDEQPDTEGTYRLMASYTLDNGLGVRGRYFDYGYENNDTSDIFKIDLYDLEVTGYIPFNKLDLLVFAGLRAADIEWSDENGSDGYTFDGTGFTVGLESRYHFASDFAFMTGVRYSHLFGDIIETEYPDERSLNCVVPVTDLQAGIEYTYELKTGSKIRVGLGYESTLFSSLSGNVDNDIDPEDVDVDLSGIRFGLNTSF